MNGILRVYPESGESVIVLCNLDSPSASRTVTPADAGPMQCLAAAWSQRPGARGRVEQVLVHRPARAGVASHAVAP